MTHDVETRLCINACLRRLLIRERAAMDAAHMVIGSQCLPRPWVRQQLREWFGERRSYLEEQLRG